jgi:hypothetical protein
MAGHHRKLTVCFTIAKIDLNAADQLEVFAHSRQFFRKDLMPHSTLALCLILMSTAAGYASASATKVAEEKISLNSYPGRELQLALKVNETTEITGVTRIYLVDKRLYSLTFLHLKSMDATVAADLGKKFFASFEFKPGR